MDFNIKLSNGQILNGLIQSPGEETKAVIILVHGKASISLLHGAMSSAKYSLAHASELKVPTLMLHGSDDMICSPEGSKEFAGKTEMVELKIWDGGYHELHNEPFKDEVFTYILGWINRKITK